MYWAMTGDPAAPDAAWIPKTRLPKDEKDGEKRNANPADASSVSSSGSGSPLWENNFRLLHAQLLKLAREYPGLIHKVNAELEKMEADELWN